MILYSALVACAFAAALLVYRYDLYDREPWPLLAAVIGAGAVAMAAAGPIEDSAIRWIGGGQPTSIHIALSAAVIEELLRLAVVVAMALFVPAHFNDPMDGLIYGSAIGIGMALEETTVYLSRAAGTAPAETFSIELVRLFGHLLMGGITGFGVGMMHRHPPGRSWIWIAAACLTAGITIHFLWDYAALVSAMSGGTAEWPVPASVVLMAATMSLYGLLVTTGSNTSRAVFAPESPDRVWRRRR